MHWGRWLPIVWSGLLTLVLLGPLLAPGYVLSYDMVWVPHLTMRADFLGVGSGLPRAVPSDAVVAALDLVLPGMLIQKLVLVLALFGGGCGAARLVPLESVTGRLVAVSVYQWNPFVVERLFLGHWPVLVGYAVLPWVILAARRWRTEGRPPPSLLLLLPLGSLSASAGLATAVVVLAFTLGRTDLRRTGLAAVLALAANAPWLVSGLLHAGTAVTDSSGAAAFALDGAGSVPGPVTALGLGGIWNVEVLLPSRTGALGWAYVIVLLALAALGLRAWWAREDRRDAIAFAGCWAVGYSLALLTWLAPGAMAWLVTEVPGAGLLRDGARALALCAPLLAVAAAEGSSVLKRRLPAGVVPQTVAVGVLAVLPVMLLPDAALGLSGRLEAVAFPSAYAAARAAVLSEPVTRGDVLVLPLSSYRQPAWNGGRKVLDPIGRYLPRDYVASDDLVVSGDLISGEDPRVAAVGGALREPTAVARARALSAEGIGFVVVETDAPGGAPELAGRVLVDEGGLRLVRLEGAVVPDVPSGWQVAMGLAWSSYAGLLAAGLVGGLLLAVRRLRGPTARGRRDPCDE